MSDRDEMPDYEQVFGSSQSERRQGGADYERIMEYMLSSAINDLKPLIDETGLVLGLTVGQVKQVGHFLGEAWVAGVKAAQAEAMAQAVEAGLEVDDRDDPEVRPEAGL